MALLYKEKAPATLYVDHKYVGTKEELQRLLSSSTTLYIGNLSFYTTEEQIHELFTRCGEIKRIVMGLDRNRKTPCGFCFVEYYTRQDAEDCVRYISGTRLDDRVIRVDWDYGFREGRQYGRGKSGGQVRDEYRTDYDPGRGGYGKQRQFELERLERQRAAEYKYIYEGMQVPVGGDRDAYTPAKSAPGSGRKDGAPPPKRSRSDMELDDSAQHKRRRGSQPESRNPRFRGEDSDEDDDDADQ